MQLFVSYSYDTQDGAGIANAFLTDVPEPKNGNDLRNIQNSIAAAGKYTNVAVITWKLID